MGLGVTDVVGIESWGAPGDLGWGPLRCGLTLTPCGYIGGWGSIRMAPWCVYGMCRAVSTQQASHHSRG